MADDLSRSKTVIIIGVVLACFAVLWPYVFYPMLTASLQQTHSYKSESKTSHQAAYMRQERSSSIRPETIHPALMEKGRAIPHRTIDMQAKPGPMPGVRPTIGAGAHIPTTNKKGGGTMGIVMPIYTIGIVIFFLYSLMKVLSKPPEKDDANTSPKVKDFHMDPEYRKYVFAEEYLDKSNTSYRDTLKRKERSSKRTRLDATPAREMKIVNAELTESSNSEDDTDESSDNENENDEEILLNDDTDNNTEYANKIIAEESCKGCSGTILNERDFDEVGISRSDVEMHVCEISSCDGQCDADESSSDETSYESSDDCQTDHLKID